MKIFAIIIFLIIVSSLATALFHLVKTKNGENSDKVVKALTVRIGLSVLLFILMYLAFISGLFQPEGIGLKIQQSHYQQSLQQNP